MRSLLATIWLATSILTSGEVRRRRINAYAGPYIAYGYTFAPCPSDGTMVAEIRASHFNPSKPYDLQVISGNFTLTQAMDDSLSTHTDMAVRSANQWKQNALLLSFPRMGCSTFRNYIPDLYRILAKHTGASMDRSKPCVIPPSRVSFHNEPVNWTFPGFPVLPYGRYRFREKKQRPGAKMLSFCIEVDCQVIPQP